MYKAFRNRATVSSLLKLIRIYRGNSLGGIAQEEIHIENRWVDMNANMCMIFRLFLYVSTARCEDFKICLYMSFKWGFFICYFHF